jgi:signal transduction histidine kinase
MTTASYRTLYQRAQFLNQLGRDLERVSQGLDPSRVVRFALRRLGEVIEADLAIQVDVERGDGSLGRPYTLPLTAKGTGMLAARPQSDPAGPGFLNACREFLKHPLSPEDLELLLLRVLIEDRPMAVLGFRRPGRRFSRAETKLGQDAVEILAENLRHRERERAQALKERIYARILAEHRPPDVLYQILHGLERLLQYDHGGAILLLNPEETQLSFQAEIITWTKAKSDRIGEAITVTPDLRTWMERTTHPVLLRAGSPEAEDPSIPACLREPLHRTRPGVPEVRAIIAAVLRYRGRALGVLKVRSRSAAVFTPSDLRTLDQFLPLASVTLYNSGLYKTQHDLLVTAERKTALADLARAISHDLNNAFGVILPLLQTLQRDVETGEIRPEQLAKDLEVVTHYASASSRIFQGLLSFARGAADPPRWGDINTVLDGIVRMLGPSLESKRIEVVREFAPGLPTVYFRRGEMEQLFLNLVYNARDAMNGGGTLTLRTLSDLEGILCEVIDTGAGIPEEIRARIFEPFFTTKATGSGLGLDICRSIVWDYDGRLELDSAQGRGTRVSVWLPRMAERLRKETEPEDER